MAEQDFLKIFSKRLRYYLQENDITQVELARRLGVGTTSVYNWCNGIKTPRMDKIDAMCSIFGCRRIDLISEPGSISFSQYDNIDPIGIQSLPVLGSVACGEPVFMTGQIDFYVKNTTGIKADFVLTARGDSMAGARIYDGDLVFVRKQDYVDNGEIAAVAIGDEATLKRVYYYREKNLLILKPENPQFEDMIYSGSELDEVHILGKAIAFQSDVR